MLIQIEEPKNNDATKKKYAIGIDLGTTNSLIAKSINHTPLVIADEKGRTLHPSIIEFSEVHTPKHVYKQEGGGLFISSIKRLMGRSIEEMKKTKQFGCFKISGSNNNPKLELFGKEYSPIEISAMILAHLKRIAEKDLGQEIKDVVITVPAYFDDAARNATKDAAKIAGLSVLRLINEPTAAAYAYGLDQKKDGVFLVYDLGGGTFDASLLAISNGVFQVLATAGDTMLGGDDFDHNLADLFQKHFSLNLSNLEYQLLVKEAQKTKENIGDSGAKMTFTYENQKYELFIDNKIFDQAILPLIKKTLLICDDVLESGKVKKDELDEIILVGGSTKLEYLRSQINEYCSRKALTSINPEEVVAVGAALQADSLVNGSDNLLLDVNPLSLGVEVMGGMVEKIIDRNSPIPAFQTKLFTTYVDGQTKMGFKVVQGEREMVKDCRALALFELSGIPPMKAGLAKIEVSFRLDADGLLSVSATELTTKRTQSIEIKPSYGMGREEIEKMIYDSIDHFDQDMREKKLAEFLINAEMLIKEGDKIVNEHKELFSVEEYKSATQYLATLKQTVAEKSYKEGIHASKQFEEFINPFFEARLNKYLNLVSKGKDLKEFEKKIGN